MKGTTILHIAANNGDMDLARYLVDKGADSTIQDELYGGAPDGWANHHGHPEVQDYLRSIREEAEQSA